MRVLSFDPGAERMGYGVIEGDGETAPVYIDSGVTKCPRNGGDFQPYKLSLEKFWTDVMPSMILHYKPIAIINEIVPAVGGGNFIVATQSNLASAAITVVHVVAYQHDIPVIQIGATTIKKKIGGRNTATKVAVRNGVIKLLPVLAPRRSDWVKVFDEPDGIATGLTYLGYNLEKVFDG